MADRIGSVTEDNTSGTSVLNGTLASGNLAGMTVVGVAFAGRQTGNVASQFEGIFGTLQVNADGTFQYVLDNTDTDTDLLSSGETALDRFVITYRLGGQAYTMDVEIAVNGRDESGQTWIEYDSIVRLGESTEIDRDTFVRFNSDLGYATTIEYRHPDEAIDFTNFGSIAFTSNGERYEGYAAAPTTPRGWFENFGRITAASHDQFNGSITAVVSFGANHGVLSAVHTAIGEPGSIDGRAIGGAVELNTGLIEVISNQDAYGVWTGGGDFENSGFIYVEGGSSYNGEFSDPLGIIGLRAGGTGNTVNSGTVYVVSNADTVDSVGFRFFAGSTNVYNLMTFDNSGTIVADRAIELSGNYQSSIDLLNTGLIEGTLEIITGVNQILNDYGAIWRGDFSLGPNPDLLTNGGQIEGTIEMGTGADRYDGIGGGRVIGDVHGGLGNDLLSGGNQTDRLFGDDGSDILIGGAGADYLSGGSGGDLFIYHSANDSTAGARDTIADFTSGSDVIDISALGVTQFTLTSSGSSTILRATTASGTLEVLVQANVVASDIRTTSPGSDQQGTALADSLYARVGGGSLVGLGGDDALFGSSGNDILDGGSGIDHMFGGDGDDIYFLADGGDLVVETADGGTDEVRSSISFNMPNYVERGQLIGTGNTAIYGNDMGNVLIGNSGNNILFAGGGDNILTGGLGADWIRLHIGTNRVIYNSIQDSTAASTDRLQTNAEGFARDNFLVDLSALNVLHFTITGERNILDAAGAGVFYINFTEVTVTTDAGDLVLLIDAAIDLDNFDWNRPDGVGGILYGSADSDNLWGSSRDDQIFGEGSADTVDGDIGNDLLDGGGGNDMLLGGEGQDILFGGAGWDTLEGGDGDDTMNGGNGLDTASYATSSSGVKIALSVSGGQDTRGAGIDTLVSIENLIGSSFADSLTGDDWANSIAGGAGDDLLYGGAHQDELFGEDGDDILDGGSSSDLLDGGTGIDIASYLSANQGVSVTLATAGWAQNTLGGGWDTLVSIEGIQGSNFADVLLGGVGQDYLYGEDGRDEIRGNDGSDTIDGGTGTDWLFGGAGWDTIHGGGWSDYLFGENGNDTLSGGYGNDRLNGGTGNDVLDGGVGADILLGGWGIDEMTGGSGADTFLFERAGHSGRYITSADTITDFNQADGDIIDLSAIDAISGTTVDNAFTFIGENQFSGTAGELQFFHSDGDTLLAADIDGDGSADMFIHLVGDLTMTAADFVL